MEEKRMPKLTLVEVFIEIANTENGKRRVFFCEYGLDYSNIELQTNGALKLVNMDGYHHVDRAVWEEQI